MEKHYIALNLMVDHHLGMGQRVKTYYFDTWGIHIRHFPDFSHPFVAKQWGVKGELLALRPSPAVAIQLGDLELFGAFGWFLKIQDGGPLAN
jgi:hypothetical protein